MKNEESYDSIGESYIQITETIPQRKIEVQTILDMLGDVKGKSILDLACGFGYYGRELRKNGASKVIGVDISEKMIEIAREKSRINGDDIEFYVIDVRNMGSFGKFDIVNAVWLFNYATSIANLEKMFQVIANNLKLSGKLISYTIEPDYQLSKGNCTPYGINILKEENWNGGFRYKAEYVSTPPVPFTFYKWSREQYELTSKKAGFKSFEWREPLILNSDIEKYPEGFWDTYQNNCLQTGFICQF
ncbi:class I SAM-dependent methyltransferase [Xenorhabdus sp. M]|uniref:Class I SAM-dependent methyltransferase n=1 Tax=Xenorhabdus szentirmaii TaxID=290112 RepID=A0AAW3YS49_9GAMM|nr:class I SAM-dependent methyltransferase [Xenorhabdus sp. M]MBD2800426.1 class I SAM-dependent methyltransferase [Xenorhabdus sp. M]